jgi:hypothetical protein
MSRIPKVSGGAFVAAFCLISISSSGDAPPADKPLLCATQPHGAGGLPLTLAQRSEGARMFDGLGDFHRPVSTNSPAAQPYFDQGMRFLWAFNHDEATRSFAKAPELEPQCAMGRRAYCGPELQPSDDGRAAGGGCLGGAAAGARHAGGTTPVEQALIAALAQRNQDSGPLDPSNEGPVLVAYAQSMKTVAERFPADFAMGHVARPVRLAGAPGLGGRGDEASPDPGKAVPAAERLPGMMPAPGPLEHMPAHIRRLIEVPRALVIYVRGQSHGRGAGISSPGFNLQADYINFWLKFVGVNEVKNTYGGTHLGC